MAITLQQKLFFNLGEAVASRLNLFANERQTIQLKEEQAFYQQVMEKGLSYEEQKAFRQAQIEREQKRGVPDETYIRALQKEVFTLNKNIRYQKVRDAYQASLLEVLQNRKSLADHKTFLERQIRDNSDADLNQELRNSLNQVEQQVITNDQTILDNQIILANQDKSIPFLNEVIGKVKLEKAKALAGGDKVRASALDIKLQALNQNLEETKVTDKINNLSINRARSVSAISYLQAINNELNNADAANPITIGGVRYGSEQDFWTGQRDKYLVSDFFTELQNEYDGYINSVSQINGQVPIPVLDNINTDFDKLRQQTEMQPFINKLDVLRTGVMAQAIEKTATNIYNSFILDQDASKALADLETLQNRFGISQNSVIQKVVQQHANIKAGGVEVFSQRVQDLVQKGISYQNAVKQTTQELESGQLVSAAPSPLDIATKTPGEVVGGLPQKTQEEAKQTITPPVSPSPQVLGATTTPQTPGQQAEITPPTFNPLDLIGQRSSAVNPAVTEFYNKQTGQGFSNPQALYGFFIGKRASPVNPAIQEYFVKQTGKGFGNEKELFNFASNLGLGKVTNFNQIGV